MRRGTYSIVAHDPESGQIGVAVQSHWFGVGTVVPWAAAGVGAVATQSVAEPRYGPHGLALLRSQIDPAEALRRMTRDDPAKEVRQVALVSASGQVATHTGPGCIPHAGHKQGDGFSCQANLMLRETVPDGMAAAFEESAGRSLDERLLAALDAGEAEGGDVRGRQSAALVVVPAQGDAWERLYDLRVDDHPDPLAELRRLHTLQRAYDTSERAEELMAEGRHDEAAPVFERAAELAPDSDELLFWAGLGAAQGGDLEAGVERVRRAIAVNPGWRELLPRLEPDIAPSAARVLERLRAEGDAARG